MRLEDEQSADAEALYPARPLEGIIGSLSDEQVASALAHDGPDGFGKGRFPKVDTPKAR